MARCRVGELSGRVVAVGGSGGSIPSPSWPPRPFSSSSDTLYIGAYWTAAAAAAGVGSILHGTWGGRRSGLTIGDGEMVRYGSCLLSRLLPGSVVYSSLVELWLLPGWWMAVVG